MTHKSASQIYAESRGYSVARLGPKDFKITRADNGPVPCDDIFGRPVIFEAEYHAWLAAWAFDEGRRSV